MIFIYDAHTYIGYETEHKKTETKMQIGIEHTIKS